MIKELLLLLLCSYAMFWFGPGASVPMLPSVPFHLLMIGTFIGSGQGPVRDFGTERALVEPLGPNTTNFPS